MGMIRGLTDQPFGGSVRSLALSLLNSDTISAEDLAAVRAAAVHAEQSQWTSRNYWRPFVRSCFNLHCCDWRLGLALPLSDAGSQRGTDGTADSLRLRKSPPGPVWPSSPSENLSCTSTYHAYDPTALSAYDPSNTAGQMRHGGICDDNSVHEFSAFQTWCRRKSSRGDRIRTYDFLLPKQARCQLRHAPLKQPCYPAFHDLAIRVYVYMCICICSRGGRAL